MDMRKNVLKFVLIAAIGLGITACGFYRYEKRAPWRSRAEAVCMQRKLVQETDDMTRKRPINNGACGMDTPFEVLAFSGGTVRMKTQQTLACPIIPAIEAWIAEVVQPAASLYYGTRVVEMYTGSYSCRGRNNQRGAKLSEHSFGNAFDVLSFTFENGQTVTVKNGWVRSDAERNFLREVFVASCTYFTTVLGPGSDAYHADHFHLDLARHDQNWTSHYCRPVLKYTPSLQYPRAPRRAYMIKE